MQQNSSEPETGHSLSTPPALARELAGWLIYKARAFNPSSRTSVIDPQCGAGWFLSGVQYAIGRQSHWGFPILNGFDIDPAQEAQASDNIRRVTGHCVACERALGAIVDADPTCGRAFDISVCNPPFGTRWKASDGTMMDSVAWTWRFATSYSNCGVIICPEEFESQCQIPPDQRGRIRIIDRKAFRSATYWPSRAEGKSVAITWERFGSGLMRPFSWQQGKLPFIMQAIRDVMADERRGMPAENIWLDGQLLKSNASVLDRIRKNLSRDDVERLGSIDGKHPVTLAADIETRSLLKDFASSRLFSISPDAMSAINAALSDSANGCVPIMPVTDFQRLAYCDDIGQIRCIRNYQPRGSKQPVFRQDRLYRVYPRSYNKSSFYSRNQQVFSEVSHSASLVMKDYMLLGEDKEIIAIGDGGRQVRFRTTTRETAFDLDEGKFFDFFEKPSVQSVAEKFPDQYERNKNILLSMEACGGFGFYDGQIDYLSRVLVRDSAIIAAETGSGKTLCAIAAIIAKGAKRALIIAPQATTRSSDPGDDDEEGEPTGMTASQWHSEIEKFAGYMKVYDLFSVEDYERLILPDGTLPFGIYVSYYEAFLTNGAIEERPPTWMHNRRLRDYVGAGSFLPGDDSTDEVDSIGETEDGTGIRCIVKPSLATTCGDQFDWIGVDEAHMLANVEAKRTKTFIRLQSKYKYAFTATPIKNRVDDLFPVMGWLCVPDWYKGGRCSSAWPYRREDYNLFLRTYLCAEVDIGQKAQNAAEGKGYTPKKTSVISSPARLLRIISPTVAYISKSNCSSTYVKPKINDIRVPLGAQQARLYQFYSDLANVPGGKTPRVRYAKQLTILRGICTDPVALGCNHPPAPTCSIDLTPKVLCVLNLTADILTRGEQVVIVNSRHVITDVIERYLKQAGVEVSRIDSTVNPDDQPAQSRMFKDGKTRVLLMGIKCAQGHNYPMCPNLIVSSLEYSNGSLEQALGRVDRLNSVRVPSIYVILNKGTIEEMMFDIVATKDDSARICLRGQRAPRDFKPVDISEVLAESLYRPSSFSDVIPEETCQAEWPDVLGKIRLAM